MRSDRERLFDILDAVERIEAQAARGYAAFAGDELAQTAVIRWVEIIGEVHEGSPKSFGRRTQKCRGGRWSRCATS